MQSLNWFVIMILGVWLIAAITCFGLGSPEPIGDACFFSVIAGLGYVLVKHG